MCNKIKILFVVPGYSLGGTTSSLVSLFNSDFIKRYDVDVFAINKRPYIPSSLVTSDIGLNELTTAYYSDFSSFRFVDRLKFFYIKLLKQVSPLSKLFKQWITAKTIKMIERRKQYDYVVAFQENVATHFVSHFNCVKKIAWIHCDYAFVHGDTFDELDVYDMFSRIVCVSQFTKKGFVKRYPALEKKVIAINNLFDAERVLQKAEEPLVDNIFDVSVFTIISVGRVCDVKQFNLIPQIAQNLVLRNLEFKWYILGQADDIQEYNKLIEAIKQYGVENNVFYLGCKSNPYPYFRRANLLVSLSKSEACPMIFNEAKILCLPILSSDFGAAFEFIEEGKDGIITTVEQMPQMIADMADGAIAINPQTNNNILNWNGDILSQLAQLFSI